MGDTLQRFLFENLQIRGELVHLDATWRAVLERHDYPEPVREMLAQSMVAGALLAATLKFEGSITLQVQGDGPINLLVVQATADRTLRGMAQWQDEVPSGDLRARFGSGRMVITIDSGRGDRYQGIVDLEGESMSDALDNYLERSEQLATRMWLAYDGNRASGLLVQKLPDQSVEDVDAWDRVVTLGQTVTGKELLDLDPKEVVHRLFHEEDIRLFEPELVSFRCSCSRERVKSVLRGLGREEVQDILAKEGSVSVNCDFCNQHYGFDAVDVEQLFTEQPQPSVAPTRH
jgi:molecular chaperone Hsp33